MNEVSQKKITSSAIFLFVAFVTVSIPDWDQYTNILLHRSAITHSILIPFLLDKLSSKYSEKKYSIIISSIYFAFLVHLSGDLFPNSWRGFALISFPIIGWIGILSPLWIFANIIGCAYFCAKKIKEQDDSIYPNYFYILISIGIIYYFLKGESFWMIPIAFLSLDYFLDKKIFKYFTKISKKQTSDYNSNFTRLKNDFDKVEEKIKNKTYNFFTSLRKFIYFIIKWTFIIGIIILLIFGIIIANEKYNLFESFNPKYIGFNKANESSHENFKYKNKPIHPAVISYIDLSLEPRLVHEEEFSGFVILDEFYRQNNLYEKLQEPIGNTYDLVSYRAIAEVINNIFLVETHWDWGKANFDKYSYFLMELKEGKITVIDKEIPYSVWPTYITHYKFEENKLVAFASGCMFDLDLNKDEQIETISSC
tara:strand:+ start:105 stop:1373 length:1269 start_codon:yes stop_codon:yes gene_type:complete